MVDNIDDFDRGALPQGPGPEPEPLSDLPADLFDDPDAHASPLRDAWPESDPGRHAEPMPAGDGPPPVLDAPRPLPTPARSVEMPSEDVPHHPIFPVIVGVFMLAALAGACVMNYQAQSAPAEAANPAKPATPPVTSPVDQLAESHKTHQSRLDDLSDRVKELQAKLDTFPKPEPAPDLKPLEAKVAALATAAAPAADLEGRVKTLDKSVGELREALAGLKAELKKGGTATAAAMTPKPTESPAPAEVVDPPKPAEVADPAAAALAASAPLFKASKFKEANDALRKAVEADSKDARVWYYAALSQGKATGQWTGEAVRLARKGVEREQAGTPDAAAIDTSLADLPADLKKWVDFYRKQVKR